MRVDRISLSEWDEVLPGGTDIFHQPRVLTVLDEHVRGELTLYAGFKGEEPVALLPIFVRRVPFGRVAVSPPPGTGLPHLGPVISYNGAKRRKRERVNGTFAERVTDDLAATAPTTAFRMICSPGFTDPRPYGWETLDLSPAFTYVLDVDRPLEDILNRFSRSLRREIRHGRDLDVSVRVEGADAGQRVFEQTLDRYDDQDRTLPVDWEYVRDLLDALDERYRVYVARDPSDRFLGGITVLYAGDTAYFWQGGAKESYENISVNSLIHWNIISDIADDASLASISRYDLMGANTKRLCKYKAKFGAELVPYYIVQSDGIATKLAKRLYQVVH